jgi:aspartate kinase
VKVASASGDALVKVASASGDALREVAPARGVYPDRVPLLVQKFGGTSVADADRIRAVADHVARTRSHGNDVVVVVSAMGKATDDLIRLAGEVSRTQPGREMDMLLTAGERISMALLCMALADQQVPAVSFTGSQAGIITDSDHTRAKILEIRPDRLRAALAAGQVPVVAGFQGVSTDRDVTTLGRGGSDTTAVALAAALGAEVCEIYTDVPGVFNADPRLVPSARKLERVSFEEMLEISSSGGRVLALRSVEFARNHSVNLHVRSSFTWEPGTWVVREDPSMEQPIVSAVTHDVSEAKITVAGVPDKPGIAARLFRGLADRSINVDMIEQNTSIEGTTDISFTVPKDDFEVSQEVARSLAPELGASGVYADADIGMVSLVGAGMKTHPAVAAKMFETLAAEGINIEMISTSSIRISCVVAQAEVERAVQALHRAFCLG